MAQHIWWEEKILNQKLNMGDWVRISFLEELFDREYSEWWSREYYKVVKRECMQGKLFIN